MARRSARTQKRRKFFANFLRLKLNIALQSAYLRVNPSIFRGLFLNSAIAIIAIIEIQNIAHEILAPRAYGESPRARTSALEVSICSANLNAKRQMKVAVVRSDSTAKIAKCFIFILISFPFCFVKIFFFRSEPLFFRLYKKVLCIFTL